MRNELVTRDPHVQRRMTKAVGGHPVHHEGHGEDLGLLGDLVGDQARRVPTAVEPLVVLQV
jgi:hypothetical protein